MSITARDIRAGGSDPGGEAASLVESAMLLRWRAPELALLLADRAVTAAQDDKLAVLRADHLAVFALNRLGRHGQAVHRLFPAIRDADTPQGLRHELQVELAHCAAALGEPATALGAVRAVLAAGDDVAPVLRAGALVAAAEAAIALDRDDVVASALEEADELYREEPSLDHDTALLLRAAVRATEAARHRVRGAADKAEATARDGRELLAGLADPDHDSGEVSARLMLELALTLLDRGAGQTALQEMRPLLRRPVRAAAAGAVGRLRLALATQVHLAEGRHEPALTLLADAVEGAQRYGVDAVLAECLEGLSHVHEARDEFADALHCMRAARAAECRHRRHVAAARSTLREHCGSARREEERLVGQVTELLANAGTVGAGLEADAGSLPVEVMAEPSAQATELEIAQAQTAESELADSQVVEMESTGVAPAEAELPDAELVETKPSVAGIAEVELAEVDLAEVEVREVEVREVEVREVETPVAATEAEPCHPVDPADSPAASTSLVGSNPVPTAPPPAAVQPVVDEPTSASKDAESLSEVDSWQSRARHRRGAASALVSVSDLLPPSAFSAGRPGRRRAEEPTTDSPEDTSVVEIPQSGSDGPQQGEASGRSDADNEPDSPLNPQVPGTLPEEQDAESSSSTRREFPASGPPPAPMPRALDWESGDENSAQQQAETHQMGLGDLLAEALAAYQESRDVDLDARSTAMSRSDGIDPADAETIRDLPRYRGLGTRWTAGLTLAPDRSDSDSGHPELDDSEPSDPDPADEGDGERSESITNPLLRLPDLTAEPRWVRPESGRRSAAGD